ncbi:hypothetical protein DFA_01612 [Cavenderia fasciculata]|uniref:DDE Tnp4 domain-containing protein n=1 Tax=Cavenderia fasciculata TaxID=261658 RepID=F4PTQ6_CACFS|nr:uncharacterized protein DFA_01612 [Cavenderia fasciculata]EGG21726.1 hypothetical protein DFA_01612 [Cavenderia fasciculata]|eukprot:XP_004359576.1 hypothetical protein DFA_01612 [Cavenderia fasciculata]
MKTVRVDVLRVLDIGRLSLLPIQKLINSGPTNDDKKTDYYSGKKGYFSVTKLVFCCPKSGKILFIAPSRPGSRNDMSLASEQAKKWSILGTNLRFKFTSKDDTLDIHYKIWCGIAYLQNSFTEIRK